MNAILIAAAEFLAEKLWRRWFRKECEHDWTDVASSGIGKLQECRKCQRRRFVP